MTTHSRILAWEIPGTEEPGRLQSMGSQRVGHDLGTEHVWFIPHTKLLFHTPFSFSSFLKEKKKSLQTFLSIDYDFFHLQLKDFYPDIRSINYNH